MPALIGDVITTGDSRPIELENGEVIRAFMRPVSEPIALNGERLRRFTAALLGDGLNDDLEPMLAKFECMGVLVNYPIRPKREMPLGHERRGLDTFAARICMTVPLGKEN